MENRNKIQRMGLLMAILAFGLPFAAVAAEIPERGPAPFEAFDTNGDAQISEAEFDALRAKRIEARNNQGRRGRGAVQARTFTDFDSNGDGILTRAELKAGQDSCCPQGQADNNCRGMKRGRGQGRGAGRVQGRGAGRSMDMPVFADFDRNGDGILLADEFQAGRNERIGKRAAEGRRLRNLPNAPRFEDIDTNGDGQVTATEFAAHQAEHCKQGRKN